jgi:hypothetical protein
VALVALEANFLVQVLALHISMSSAVAVLQPMMAPYSLGAIAFLYWLALTLAQRTARRNAKRVERTWGELSDAAFGVYLVHPLLLGAALAVLVPHVRTWLPVALTVALLWVLTSAGSIAVTVALLRTPALSRLVGRAGATPSWLARWLAQWRTWQSSARARLALVVSANGAAWLSGGAARRQPTPAETAPCDDVGAHRDLANVHAGE